MTVECKWKTNETVDGSAELTELLKKYGTAIEPRIGAEPINIVTAGAARLQESSRQQTDSHGDRASSTQLHRQLCHEATGFLADRRKAIARTFPKDKATQKDFGIGMNVSPSASGTIAAGLERFVTAGKESPAKVQAAAISTDEIASMENFLVQIEAGRRSNNEAKTGAKSATIARNTIQLEVETAMIKVVNAATLVFAKQPEIVELFKSTLPRSRSGARKNKKTTGSPVPEIKPA